VKTLTNPFRFGVIRRLNVLNGELVANVFTSDGAIFDGVPLRRYGQGSQFPPSVGQTVHLYFPDGATDLPYVVGVDVDESTLLTDPAPASSGEDYSPSVQDAVIEHEGSRLSLSQSGVTIESDASVRVQLTSGQVLRVSLEGSSTDRPLKGQAFIDALFTLLSSFELRLSATETAVGIPPNPLNPTVTATKANCEATKSEAVTLS
jgi:hypothetical protein